MGIFTIEITNEQIASSYELYYDFYYTGSSVVQRFT